MTVRSHLFPFRTQKLSSLVPKIVGWTRPVKIGRCRRRSSIRILKPYPDGLYGPLVKRLRQRPLTPLTSVRFRYGSPYAPLAQLVEQLTLNQWAQGSSPWRCTKPRKSEPFSNRRRVRIFCFLRGVELGRVSLSQTIPEGRAGQAVTGGLEGKKKGAPRRARLV